MVNIAVCDDDTQFAAELENRILSYGKQKAVSLDTEVFSDGDSILQEKTTASRGRCKPGMSISRRISLRSRCLKYK